MTISRSASMSSTMSLDKNPFGKGIEYRKGQPIELLHFPDENGRMRLNEDALRIIRRCKEPVGAIAIVGSYRRGKSWFANVLHGRHDGFKLGSTVHGETRGVQMWDRPFLLNGMRVIVLDCEGIDDPERDPQWATKLFILCLAISSSFVYNISSVVGRQDIGKLFLMTDLTRYIQPPMNCKFLPRLVILLRDFMLQNPDSFREYFLAKLRAVDEEAAIGIEEYFGGELDVFGLPVPGVPKTRLQHLHAVDTDELDNEFVKDVCHAVHSILGKLRPKYIGASPMTGEVFAKFLEECVHRLNDDDNQIHLKIPSEYDSIVEFVASRAIERCLSMYAREMRERFQAKSLPISWAEFENVHTEVLVDVENEFFSQVIGSGAQIVGSGQRLRDAVHRVTEQYRQANSQSLNSHNKKVAVSLWQRHVDSRLLGKNPFTNEVEFQSAVQAFEKDYEAAAEKSPEAYKVIAEFRSAQYQHATTLLHKIGVVNAELVAKMRQANEGQCELAEVAAREMEVRGALATLRLERDQMEQAIGAKLETLEGCLQAQFATDEYKEVVRRAREQTTAQLLGVMTNMREEHNRALNELDSGRSEEIVELKKQLCELTERRKKVQDFLRLIVTATVSASLQYFAGGSGAPWKG